MDAMETAPVRKEEEIKSPLHKPLNELTEDDLLQVTREDCRRFLKQKGMRRPSWNKSQAIQQVISLKALLEAIPDEDGTDDAVPSSSKSQKTYPDSSPPTPLPQQQHSFLPLPSYAPMTQQDSSDVGTDETSCRKIDPSVEITGLASRVASEPAAAMVGEMAVFYDGNVNVFDSVPVEKASVIMRIAASKDYCNSLMSNILVDLNQPFNFPQPNPDHAMVPQLPLPPQKMAHNVFAAETKTVNSSSRCLQEGGEQKISQQYEPEFTLLSNNSLVICDPHNQYISYMQAKRFKDHYGKLLRGGSSNGLMTPEVCMRS